MYFFVNMHILDNPLLALQNLTEYFFLCRVISIGPIKFFTVNKTNVERFRVFVYEKSNQLLSAGYRLPQAKKHGMLSCLNPNSCLTSFKISKKTFFILLLVFLLKRRACHKSFVHF